MKSRETILEELRAISPAVANLDFHNVFEVPEGYFDTLPANILLKIKSIEPGSIQKEPEASSFLEKSSKSNPFTVKEGYFDSLAGEIMSKIRMARSTGPVDEEILELSPLLAGLRNKQVFEVPEGYFEGLESSVKFKLREEKKGNVIKMGAGRRSIVNYAAAASVVAMIGIGALLMFRTGNKTTDNNLDSTGTARLDTKVEGVMPQVSDEALANFLDNTFGNDGPDLDNQTDDNSLALLNLDDNSVRDMLKGASDNDIKDYLDENSLEGNSLTSN
ncbi:MAG: hypothetical protein C5B52_00490 [Bacteroidetes bacterium]|nr:MAG: hypothetical protein C5B52_00490 [Bacteroidota bacterium]